MTKILAGAERWWWLLALGLVVGATAGAMSTVVSPPKEELYEATSVVLLDVGRATSAAAPKIAAQAGIQVTRGAVPIAAAKALGESDVDALASRVTVDVDESSLAITIAAESPDRERASEIVDAFTNAFLATSNQDELDALDDRIGLLDRQVASANARLADFDQQNPGIAALSDTQNELVRQRSDLLTGITDLDRQLDQEKELRDTTTGPYARLGEPKVSEADGGLLQLPADSFVRIGLLALLGLVLSALVVALIERLNPRLDSADEVKDALQLPILAQIPLLRRRETDQADHVDPSHFVGAHAEAYRRLRSAMQFAMTQNGTEPAPRSFVVTSAGPREGKTTTVACAAFAMAEAGVPTVALNGDTRRPTLHQRFGVAPAPGLAEMAQVSMDRLGVDAVVQSVGDPEFWLWVVASGASSPLTPDLAEAARTVIETTKERGGTILVDSAPVLATSDAVDLLPLVDRVIFVVRCGQTTRRDAMEALEILQQRNARVLGCVCVGSHESTRQASYYSDYYLTTSAPPPTHGATAPATAG